MSPRSLNLVARNTDFLAPWEPLRQPDWTTGSRQREVIMDALDRHAAGTAAVALAVAPAFGELRLHRMQTGTQLHNLGSQHVRRNGFTEIEVAPSYLKIAGSWQDHPALSARGPRRYRRSELSRP